MRTFGDTWSFKVGRDRIIDEPVITARRHPYRETPEFGTIRLKTDISLFLILSHPSNERLCVGGHNFPGKKAVIRVGGNEPVRTQGNGCVRLSQRLDRQMREGKTIILRGYIWPYDGHDTQTVELSGYAAVDAVSAGQAIQLGQEPLTIET